MKKTLLIIFAVGMILSTHADSNPFESSREVKPVNKIDELVFAKLKEKNIPPSKLCSDEVFLRRVHLDLVGTLPIAQEVRFFLKDKRPNKRKFLVDRLFARKAFADYWSLKWCDILRVKAEFPSNLWPNAVQAYHRWIRTAIENNMPYDQFARALLTESGSNFRDAPVNFYRAVKKKEPVEILDAVALTFMGARTKHWTQEEKSGMAVFFAKVGYKKTMEWKEEIVYFDMTKEFLNPETKKPYKPKFLNGKQISLGPDEDPREAFANWLIAKDNPWFARNIVNRIWFWLLGRGIIHEPDDIRKDNPPQNEELLAYLEKELIEHNYDLRHIYRLILNSATYQLSSIHNEQNKDDVANFSHYYVRQLDAEVLIDAICLITGPTERYSSKIPEPFTFLPDHERSINVADGSISSSFLEMFGRPPRDTGYLSERDNTPSSFQKLHFLNSTHIQNKILKGWRMKEVLKTAKRKGNAIDEVYLAFLTRFPTAEERELILTYAKTSKIGEKNVAGDLVWALINTKEFIFRH